MKQVKLTIHENRPIADNVIRMALEGDVSAITTPGQFINILLDGHFLRRPISVCDVDTRLTGTDRVLAEAGGGSAQSSTGTVVILYKVVGSGTAQLAALPQGTVLDVLTGLGNGFDIAKAGDAPLLFGGGIGSAPMMMLARKLIEDGVRPQVLLGFNTASEIILSDDLYELGCDVEVATADGSAGRKGFVTDLLPGLASKGFDYSFFYACGPSPMLKAVARAVHGEGEISLEERMGCGFGACMGCSVETVSGPRRICKDGPVFLKSELKWET